MIVRNSKLIYVVYEQHKFMDSGKVLLEEVIFPRIIYNEFGSPEEALAQVVECMEEEYSNIVPYHEYVILAKIKIERNYD